ncbi:MAG: flavin reductase like domain-containing protein [Linnemannia elongata]|nr:MAG: flavin reductase like domain-containing protein [Linnemannia elongata]
MLLPRTYATLAHSFQSYSTSCPRTRTASLLNACRSITPTATRSTVPAALNLGSHLRFYTTDPSSTPAPVVVASEEDQATSEKFRKVLRKVPFPVVVVSTCSPEDPNLRRGITISSFSSISLQPIPLVSFCVKLPSRASTVLHESDKFVIQFLSSEQIAHSVAFSSSVAPPPGVSKVLPGTGAGSETGAGAGAGAGAGVAGKGRKPEDKDIEELVAEANRQTMLPSSSSSNNNGDSTPTTTSTVTTPTTPGQEPDPFEVLGYTTDPESNLPVLKNTLGAIRCRTHQVMVVGDHEMWIGHVEKVLHGQIPDEKEPLLYHDRSYRHVGRRII